jgi:aminopeptidase N
MLAAWQGGWRTDFSNFSDRVYASAALYHARMTIPTDWAMASTGTNLEVVDHGNGTKTYDVVSGPVREFALSVGRMDNLTAEQDGTTIVIWYPRNTGLERIARTTATDIAAALKTFNAQYGPYPYRALECQLILDSSHINFGSEYPGFVLLYTNGTYTDGLRYTATHEVAHQWFYNVLGNDIFNEPWLDEAFAKYSPEIVEEDWFGQAAADAYYQNQVLPYAREATQGAGLSIWEYGAWKPYHRAVYGRGAQFLHALRDRVGDAAFFAGMQRYYGRHKYGIVHKRDFLAVMEAASRQDLDAFFVQWLGR